MQHKLHSIWRQPPNVQVAEMSTNQSQSILSSFRARVAAALDMLRDNLPRSYHHSDVTAHYNVFNLTILLIDLLANQFTQLVKQYAFLL